MRVITYRQPEGGDTANAYVGRCAGGSGEQFGGEYQILAASDEVLERVWEALEDARLDRSMVYDVATVSAKRLEGWLQRDGLWTPEPVPPPINEVR